MTARGSGGPIAVLGAGKVGTILALLALDAGYDVYIAGSAEPERISMIVDVIAPGAIPTTATDAAHHGHLVVLAVPLARIHTVPAHALHGKTVVDAMNYWPPVDGRLDAFEDGDRATSEIVRDILGVDRLVKTFSHMGYHELEAFALPGQTTGRKALAVVGDVPDAVTQVSDLVDAMGFDPVYAGSLAAGRRLEPGSDLFGAVLTRESMLSALAGEPVPAPAE
jgi:predicted dinucleotide-binding enzyme